MSTRPHPQASLVLLLGLLGAACGSENTQLQATGLDPAKGDAEGGTTVHIRGNRFIADGPRDVKVYFGGRQGRVRGFASDSDLVVEAPGGKPNEVVDVLVIFEPGGQHRFTNAFRYFEHKPDRATVDDIKIGPKK